MTYRLTIYAGDPVLAALDGIAPGGGGRSGDPASRSARINTICERYLLVCEAARPDLSQSEWLALCSVLGSTEAPEIEQWVSRADLAKRIRRMSVPQMIAVREVAERWWRSRGSAAERLEAALKPLASPAAAEIISAP